MDAKRCERCRNFFDPEDFDDELYEGIISFKNPRIFTTKDVKNNTFTRYLNPNHNYAYEIDLCPKCTNDFTQFMYFENEKAEDGKLKALQELVRENEELKTKLKKAEEKSIDFKVVLEKLIKNVFGIDDLSAYFNRKQDKSVNEDPNGDSNKR